MGFFYAYDENSRLTNTPCNKTESTKLLVQKNNIYQCTYSLGKIYTSFKTELLYKKKAVVKEFYYCLKFNSNCIVFLQAMLKALLFIIHQEKWHQLFCHYSNLLFQPC